MSTNTAKLGRAIAGKGAVSEIPQPTFRRGEVIDASSAGVATVTIGDDSTPVTAVASAANYIPRVGDAVDLRVVDDEVTIEGMVGNIPTVFRELAVGAAVLTDQTRGATSFGDMATGGPTCNVNVGPSGLLVVVFSAMIYTTSSNDGGVMGTALTGANSVAAEDARALIFYPLVNGAILEASRVSLYASLTPGLTTVTCKYRDIVDVGTDVHFANRRLFAIPL